MDNVPRSGPELSVSARLVALTTTQGSISIWLSGEGKLINKEVTVVIPVNVSSSPFPRPDKAQAGSPVGEGVVAATG